MQRMRERRRSKVRRAYARTITCGPLLRRVFGLRSFPQLAILLLDVRVQFLREVAREVERTDQLEHVCEIFQAVGCAHPRRELELDERVEGKKRGFLSARRDERGIGKCDRLWLSVARIVAGQEHVDRDAVFGIAQSSAAREFLDVAATEIAVLELLERLGGEEDIDVDRDSTI